MKYIVGNEITYKGDRIKIGGNLKKDGSIGSIYHTSMRDGDVSEIVEVRENTLIVKGVNYSHSNHFGKGFIEIDFDDAVDPYEHQNNPSLKEYYKTDNCKVRIVVDELLSVNDLFGENPTDEEITSFKIFTESGVVEINPTKVYNKNPFGNPINYWDMMIDRIKRVILETNEEERDKFRKLMVWESEEV